MARKAVQINTMCGKRLSELLTERNMKSSELAKIIGYTPQHISYIINSKRNLTKEAAEDIAAVFDVRPEWLLGLSDYKTDKDVVSTFVAQTLTLADAASDMIKAAASNLGYSIGYPNKKSRDTNGISFYLIKNDAKVAIGKNDAAKLFGEIMQITEYALNRLIDSKTKGN